jgi:hypothetical protein
MQVQAGWAHFFISAIEWFLLGDSRWGILRLGCDGTVLIWQGRGWIVQNLGCRGNSGKLREKMAQDSAMGRVRRLVSVYPAVTVDPQE